MDGHGRDINGTSRSEKIYSEKRKQKLYAESEMVIVGPTGKERDVQEIFEYSLINTPAKRFFFFLGTIHIAN
jgi:hypothetical protein